MNPRNARRALAALVVAGTVTTGAVAQENKPDSLTIFTSLAGSSWYGIGAGMGEIFASEGVPSNPELGAGFSNVANVASGEGELGLTMVPAISVANKGEAPFGASIGNVYVIAGLSESLMHLAVSAEAGIDAIADLKGHSFITQPVGSITAVVFEKVAAASGLNLADVDLSRGSIDVQTGGMQDRRSDGMVSVATFPAAFISELASAVPVKLLSVSDAAFAALKTDFPGVGRAVIPANTYEGQTADVPTVSAKMVVIASDVMTEDEAYWVTKTLVENIDRVKKLHGSYAKLTPEAMATVPGVPLHPGAERYYREIGVLK